MQPLSQAWMLFESGGQTVSFEDIPAGPNRVFTGILMRGTVKTHEGNYTLDIGGGESVFVPLVLRDVGTGRAEICVEIEGWPGSPDCTPIDTLQLDTSALAGCWHIEAYDGSTPVSGTLTLHRTYDSLYEGFTMDGGQNLLASANIVDGAWRITLSPIIKIHIDSPIFPINEDQSRISNLEKPIEIASASAGPSSYQFRIDPSRPVPGISRTAFSGG